MTADSELRPGAPGLSMRDIVLETRHDVKEVREAVLVLTSANLVSRLDKLESWKDQLTGKLIAAGIALGVLSTFLGIVLDHVILGG